MREELLSEKKNSHIFIISRAETLSEEGHKNNGRVSRENLRQFFTRHSANTMHFKIKIKITKALNVENN